MRENRVISAAHHAFTGWKSNLVKQHLSHESEQNSSHVNMQNPLKSIFVRAGYEHAYIHTVTHTVHKLLCSYVRLYSMIHRD